MPSSLRRHQTEATATDFVQPPFHRIKTVFIKAEFFENPLPSTAQFQDAIISHHARRAFTMWLGILVIEGN
jgi:hypothetical protein